MLKNENAKPSFPLIERILVIGVSSEEFSKFSSLRKIDLKELSNLKIKILEEYKSNELKESATDNYIENMTIFCMPEGLKVIEETNNMKTFNHSFSLITSSSKRKHCTCLTFYENYESKEKKVSISKGICIVSSQPIYATHKEILNNIFSIISNYKIKKTLFPDQLKYVYLKDKLKSYTVLKEYTILEFYFSFILNCMKCVKEEKSYYVNYIGNNAGKKCFLKFHLNSNIGYPIMDFDMTMLLDKFNVEDLIKIYMCLLMEYKLIIIFDDYQDINTLIFSFTSLIYPLKWNFPIISFITPTLIETLEAPFGMIIGIHSKYMSSVTAKLAQNDAITEETLIYNLSTKSFIYLPKKFPELPLKLLNELRSNIYLVLSEKLSLTSEIDNDDTELLKIFPNNDSYKKMDPVPFLNLKFIQVFFNFFLELIKNLESSIYFNKIKSIKNSQERFQLYDVFDANKFINDRDFHNDKQYFSFVEQFSKTLMFMQFLEKYIKHSDFKPKYKFIKKMILVLSTKENGKSLVKDMNRDYLKNKLISYHNFKLISLEDALKSYIEKLGSLSSSKNNFDDRFIWNPLENYKIVNFSVFFEKYIISDSDQRIQDNKLRKLYSELVKHKEYKQYDLEDDDDDSHPQTINIQETKMKSLIEEKSSSSKYNNKFGKDSLSSINKFGTISHKPSPSYNFEVPTNTTNIQCNNNIEHFYYNNINISTEELKDKFPPGVSMNLETSESKITSNGKGVASSINTLNSLGGNSVQSFNSINNSINNSVSSSAFKQGMNPFKSENFTARNNFNNNNDLLRKSNIANLKQSMAFGLGSNKNNMQKLNFGGLDKFDKKKIKDFSESIKSTKNVVTTRNPNSSNFVSKFDKLNLNSNYSNKESSNKKFRFIKDTNKSIHISPVKKSLHNNFLDISTQSVASNMSKIKNLENFSKLAGDDEVDLFSSRTAKEKTGY